MSLTKFRKMKTLELNGVIHLDDSVINIAYNAKVTLNSEEG